MRILAHFLKLIGCMLLFICAKFVSESVVIHNYPLFMIFEIVILFILNAAFLDVTDMTRNSETDKLQNSACVGGFFALAVLLLTILKSWFFVWMMNYVIFCVFFSMPFVRDYLYYNKTGKRDKIVLSIVLAALVIYKLVFNIINSMYPDSDMFLNMYSIGLLPFIYLFVKALANSFFVNGMVEYDGKEYYILEGVKAGRNKNSDIYIPEVPSAKSSLFTITANGEKLFIKGDETVLLENKPLKGKAEVNDGDTVKAGSEYFTVTTHRGFFHKRLIALFFFLIILNVFIFADQDTNAFIDFTTYPSMRIYAEASGYDETSPVFLVEGDTSINYKRLKLNKKFDVDIFLIMDATGNMTDRYRSFTKYSEKMFADAGKNGKSLTIHIITFADDKNDLHYLGKASDMRTFNAKLGAVRNIPGNDFKENPLDAIYCTENLVKNNNSLKVFVLFTDAPPHVKGDRGKEGVIDFTDKTVTDIEKFIISNNILFYTASYQRYTEYAPFYKNNPARFFDIENVDDIGNVLYSISRKLSSTLQIEYKTTKNKNYIDEVAVFSGDDAVYEQKNYKINKIKKRSFLRSLFEVF